MLGSAMTEPALQAILLDSLGSRTPEDQLIILSGIAEQEITSAEASVIALLSSADQAVRKQAILHTRRDRRAVRASRRCIHCF
jgi:hypothetical protein